MYIIIYITSHVLIVLMVTLLTIGGVVSVFVHCCPSGYTQASTLPLPTCYPGDR